MSDEDQQSKEPEPPTRPGSLEGIIEHIARHGTTRFDEALVTFLNGISLLHAEVVGECSAGHQYGSEFEMCVEHHDAHELASAWMQSRLEGGDRRGP
jgi:hypothetical protein